MLEAQATYRRQPLTTTLVLSSGAIGDLIEVTARIRVAGSIYLSDLWAWPNSESSHEQKETAPPRTV